MKNCRGKAPIAFTLIELLVVIAIISLLAAILFPVFAQARAKARQTACLSNLRQIGIGIQTYAQDYDGLLPYALDPSDIAIPTIWSGQPAACYNTILVMRTAGQALGWHHQPYPAGPFAPGVLDTYLKSRDLWHCPSDTGFDFLDDNDTCSGGPCPFPTRPSMWETQGVSYLYRTPLAVSERSLDSLSGTTVIGQKPVGVAQISLLFDAAGSWHGGPFAPGMPRSGLRYVTLFADGHAKLLPFDDYMASWNITFSGSSGGVCP